MSTKKIGELNLADGWKISVGCGYDGEEWYPQITLSNDRGINIPIPTTLNGPYQIGKFMTECGKKIDVIGGSSIEDIEKWLEGSELLRNASFTS